MCCRIVYYIIPYIFLYLKIFLLYIHIYAYRNCMCVQELEHLDITDKEGGERAWMAQLLWVENFPGEIVKPLLFCHNGSL